LEGGAVKLSLVTVTHRSSAVLPRLLESYAAEVERLGCDSEVVVVEQSEGADQLPEPCHESIDLVLDRPNRGYASGVNAGVAASDGEVLVLANPDTELLPGSLQHLLQALEEGWSIVGPQLVWDRQGVVLLPAPEDPAPRAELWRAARRRWPSLWQRGLTAHLDRCWRLWRLQGAEPVPCLRGPLLVLRRSLWQELGPMDEGYFLYYEETEWLWRAIRNGARVALVGDARVVHAFGHSTHVLEDRDRVEERSRQRFLRRNYPTAARALLRCIGSEYRGAMVVTHEVSGPRAVPPVEADLWLLSPFSHLIPAAGWIDGATVPTQVDELTAHGRWHLAAASRGPGRWQIRECWRWGTP
jgi:GT2 family glycosyltransferase